MRAYSTAEALPHDTGFSEILALVYMYSLYDHAIHDALHGHTEAISLAP